MAIVRHYLVVLAILMGISTSLVAATDKAPPQSKHLKNSPFTMIHYDGRKTRTNTGNRNNENPDSLVVSDLLADGFDAIDKIRLERNVLNEARKIADEEERLAYPAIDIYGENSWGEYVNPYAGLSAKAAIPDQFDIDCSEFVMPLDGDIRVTSHYGYRRRFGRMHRGIDLKLYTGDTVRAAFDGKVRICDYEGRGYGHYVVIRHPNGLETVYAHLSKKIAQKDQIVRAGEPIGLGGSTGRSTGPHLHFETRFMGIDINPAHIIDFAEGVPLRDVYTFKRNGKAPSGGATYASSNKGNANSQSVVPKVHRIRKGDTLSGIAKKYGTSVRQLCALNNLSSKAVLRVGRTIRVR